MVRFNTGRPPVLPELEDGEVIARIAGELTGTPVENGGMLGGTFLRRWYDIGAGDAGGGEFLIDGTDLSHQSVWGYMMSHENEPTGGVWNSPNDGQAVFTDSLLHEAQLHDLADLGTSRQNIMQVSDPGGGIIALAVDSTGIYLETDPFSSATNVLFWLFASPKQSTPNETLDPTA